jgi:hypothetical protein
MIEGKGLGGKRCNRLATSITNKEESDLVKLSTACGMSKSEMTHYMINHCLYNGTFVSSVQKEYCTQKAYKVVLVNKELVLTGREDL